MPDPRPHDGSAPLDPGLYELLLTTGLQDSIDATESTGFSAGMSSVDAAEVPQVLTQHLAERIGETLLRLKPARQIALANTILAALPEAPTTSTVVSSGGTVHQLHSVSAPLRAVPKRPTTPLSDTALLTNAKESPQLGTELQLEIASADRIDLLCAFVKLTGLNALAEPLADARARGVPIRVLTTTYIGATDRKAVDQLVETYGASVRVNYDSASTRLHAKAWMFHRNSGFDTAYVGSSNLSRAALLDGLEWNVRLSRRATPGLLTSFERTFDTYWQDPAFEAYDPASDAARLDEQLRRNRGGSGTTSTPISTLDVRPYPHQQEMLDDLEAERTTHGIHRNLVVAATGTGKTVVAALDYTRLCFAGNRPPLLFVAHRKEILDHARKTFRDVLKDGTFGEMFHGGERPAHWRHVFASIQSISTPAALASLDPSRFDIVIIDEFHHAEAGSYRRLLEHVQPRELLGLTATPERADGANIVQEFFGGRIASELRLWDALEADLLVPFHYFGISDDTDISHLSFVRGTYRTDQLTNIYTGNDARVRKILNAVNTKINDPTSMRALGFCVSVEHARFMARRFNEAGIPSLALDGSSDSRLRADGLQRLRDGEIACIFAVDLFNEGLDIPEIDTVLMLRPTQSSTVFLQQLGRGLRRSEGKAVLTVLDFVGHQHKEFRFDLKLRALTGRGRGQLPRDIENGFPYMPPGSQIVLDRVVQAEVLENVKTQMKLTTSALVSDIRETFGSANAAEASAGLTTWLRVNDRSLADVYGTSGRTRTYRGTTLPTTWLGLTRFAYPNDVIVPLTAADQELLRRVNGLTHVDDPVRIKGYLALLTDPELPDDLDRNLLAAMLVYSFWPSGEKSIRDGLRTLRSSKALVAELSMILNACAGIARNVPQSLGGSLDRSPLRSHARYSREELLAGLGLGTIDPGNPGSIREGVKWLPGLGVDALLVTLQKSEADYTPTTLYRDFAMSSTLFHWETQSTTSSASSTGQRYINHERRGSSVVLFVRRAKTGDIGTEPYTCLGTVRYVRSEGDRPMQIVWELDRPMPPALLLEAKAAA